MSGPMFKQPVYRSQSWLAAVRQIECCVRCGAYGTEPAHRNLGKGLGLKTDDCATAALCRACHHEIDNGKQMGREERRAALDSAIVKTVTKLCQMGLIAPVGE